MPTEKTIPFVLSLVVGTLMAGSFVSTHGGLKSFWVLADKVSWMHYWYGILLIIAVFWIGFLGTWILYSGLLWVVNRYFCNS